MYDYVKYNKKEKMPDGFDATGKDFQTKDLLFKNLPNFVITEDNKLFSNNKDLEFHGIFDMCVSDENGFFREYRMKFTDGFLVDIQVIKNSP